jgi:hypothetical protein
MSSNTPNDEWGSFLEGVKGQQQKASPAVQPKPASSSAPVSQASATMRCLKCGASNDATQHFCGACGTSLQPTKSQQPATITCGKCGAQNDASKKFCGACGTPLQGQPITPTAPSQVSVNVGTAVSGTLTRTSKGYKVASPGAVVVILCFFLPWMFVSCAGSMGSSFTGMELAFGKQTEVMAGMVQRIPGEPLILLALLAAIAVLMLAGLSIGRGKLTKLDGIGIIGLGSGALALLVIQGFIYSDQLQRSGGAQFVQLSPEIGLVGVLIGYLAVIFGGILNVSRKP